MSTRGRQQPQYRDLGLGIGLLASVFVVAMGLAATRLGWITVEVRIDLGPRARAHATAVAAGTPAPAPSRIADDVAMKGLRAFNRGAWDSAAGMLREAVARDPSRLELHYSLAIADTHIDLRAEAIREFQWVLANAPAGSTESQTARKWLTDVGVLGVVAAATPTHEESTDKPDAPQRADVGGEVKWNEPDPPVKISRLQLFLKGIGGTKTQDEYYVLRTDEEGRFEFKNVVPGPYKLVDRIAGTPEWRLRVQLEPGQRLALDLTPNNSTRVRDDFPDDK